MTVSKIFTTNWKVYQEVISHDYMHHLAFGNEISNTFQTIKKQAGLSVLDIGCGDANQICNKLQQLDLASYTGYDLSEPALELAKKNLSNINANIQLLKGDMQELLRNEKSMFDVIHSSFAIHHLQDDEKQNLFKECYKRLNKNGILLYTDVFRPDGQNRETYLAAYTRNMKANWPMLNEEERQLICDHINNYDFPANINDCNGWLTDTGFTIKQVIQPDAFHYMIIATC